jgi:hypothetical protein
MKVVAADGAASAVRTHSVAATSSARTTRMRGLAMARMRYCWTKSMYVWLYSMRSRVGQQVGVR